MNFANELITQDQQVQDLFAQLNQEQINRKAAADKWSVAQCLHHIITTNMCYFPALNGLHDQSYPKHWLQKLPVLPSLFGYMIHAFVKPDRKKRSKTVRIFEPSYSKIELDICAEFHQHSNSLVALIKTINQLDLKSIIISSPVNPNIVLSAEKALQIIVDHGQRHINQAIEVTKQLSINA